MIFVPREFENIYVSVQREKVTVGLFRTLLLDFKRT